MRAGHAQRPAPGALRICLATSLFPPTIGGEEKVAALLARELAQAGHRVIVATQRHPIAAAAEEREGVAIRRTIRPVSWGPLFGPTYCLTLARFLTRQRGTLDLIQASYLYWDAVTIALLKPLLRVPLVVRMVMAGPGGDVSRFTGMRFWPLTARSDRATLTRLVQLVARRADGFIVLNKAAVAELTALGVPAARCHIVPNGIEVSAFSAPPTPRPLGGPWRILCVGRLTGQKGQDVLLKALPRVIEAVGPVTLDLLGDGPDREQLRVLATTLGLQSVIRFRGKLDDVRPALAAADLFVLPSRFEGHPLALLEAMAARIAVVASDVAGNAEAVRPEVDGLLVPPEDPDALADAMAALLRDRERAGRLAETAAARVREAFSLEAMLAGTLAVYRRVLEAHSSGQK